MPPDIRGTRNNGGFHHADHAVDRGELDEPVHIFS